ncbi:MAG: DNA polymerase III subunit alpha, partial [Clostridiales bacterium]|nr:DNA polymerase III subunit alpha [Clostridiales bacterium]
VIVFPKNYERYRDFTAIDEKVFVTGRVSAEADQDGKVICDRIVPFDDTVRELWLKFPTRENYEAKVGSVMEMLENSVGKDELVVYIEKPRSMKKFGIHRKFGINETMLESLRQMLGEANVCVLEKGMLQAE